MDATTNDALMALGEASLQVFLLRRRVQELEQELGNLYARMDEANQPTPIKDVSEAS